VSKAVQYILLSHAVNDLVLSSEMIRMIGSGLLYFPCSSQSGLPARSFGEPVIESFLRHGETLKDNRQSSGPAGGLVPASYVPSPATLLEERPQDDSTKMYWIGCYVGRLGKYRSLSNFGRQSCSRRPELSFSPAWLLRFGSLRVDQD
jgi:hypothetical protein